MKHCPNPECPGLRRDGIAPEYLATVARCAECREPLAIGAALRPSRPSFRALATVYLAADAIQAHLLRGRLEDEGLVVHLRGEALKGAMGELPADVVQIEVQVPSEDAEQGRALALRFERDLRRPLLRPV